MDKPLVLNTDLKPKSVVQREQESQVLNPVTYRSMAKVKRYFKKHKIQLDRISDLINIPEEGEQYRIITYNAFNAFTFIFYMLKNFDIIDEVYFVTYNMNEKSICGMFDLIDQGKIKKATVVISESIVFRMPKRINQLKLGKGERGVRLALAWNHSKITLMRCGDKHFVFEGSGNLSENPSIEQYVIEQDKEMYDFHKSWIEDIFNGKSKHKKIKVL